MGGPELLSPSISSHTSPSANEPTPTSVWRAASGLGIDGDLLAWAPDVFALTDLIIDRAEGYRFVLSPPEGAEWPPSHAGGWAAAVREAGQRWAASHEEPSVDLPALLIDEWALIAAGADHPLRAVADGSAWRLCEALLTVHAIADEACAGLGVALEASDGHGCVFRARGRELLARTGSVARFPTDRLRVLPKACTPASGSSHRSLSRYASLHGPGLEVRWHKMPSRRRGTEPQAGHVNFLLLPWPLRIRESDFRPLPRSVQRRTNEPSGLFEFAPSEGLDLDLVDRMLVAAKDEVDSVDVVYLPESAVEEGEVAELEALLAHHGVGSLHAGVRQSVRSGDRLPANWVHSGVNPQLEKGALREDPTGEDWFHVRQNKHHRWSLDESQIYQYHLGGALHPGVRWWEAMEVPRRSVQFIEFGELLCVFLVCEDLAQNDDVAEILRSVGPTIVLTPLLDGPQLTSRWAARYASVLADDPGSAVLTLTSYGMVQRSRPGGRAASPVIAMWKDPTGGIREIPLESGAHGVLLTGCAQSANRRSIDGREPTDNSTQFFDVAVHQVRPAQTGSGYSGSSPRAPAGPRLEAGELTILTSWADAVAEALAVTPERAVTTASNPRSGASWRGGLGLPEPSPSLDAALDAVHAAIVAVEASLGRHMTLDSAIAAVRDEQKGHQGGGALPRRVLAFALESRRARQIRSGVEVARPRG